ncbi:MAG: hypothetical protein L3J34_10405 [Flavobacteriaceae bacterium]|nr:hypothetical protein [Flavobacteriaceae bacterium]
MMKTLWIFLLLTSLNTFSQSAVKKFTSLSSPEKWWVIFHPFQAKKAFYITNDVLKITDSIGKTQLLDTDINGGKLDAFKHSYWLARLSIKIGARASLKLGEAHEKGNYRTFKKMQIEDGVAPDKIATTMDLFNNEIGVKIANKNEGLTKQELIHFIIWEINKGSMKIIKKDTLGNFLTCDNLLINLQTISGKWENDKCLVASNRKQ